MTVLELITSAMKEVGAVASGENPTDDEAQDCLVWLNRMVNGFGVDRLTIYEIVSTTKALTSGTQTYTIGTGGNINIARPVWIERAGLLDSASSPDLEVPRALYTPDVWASIRLKTLTSTWFNGLYYDHAYTAGLGNISLYPVPTSTTLSLVLYVPTPITVFADVNASIVLPPGYEDVLHYGLAVRIAPMFGREASQTTKDLAADTMGLIKRANVQPIDLVCDPALTTPPGRGSYNWRSDQPS